MYIALNIETTKNQVMHDIWQRDILAKGLDPKKEFPPPITWDIFCLGFTVIDNEFNIKHIGTGRRDQESEFDILRLFSDYVGKYKPTIVTWCGKNFDLPVMVYRCLHHNIPIPWYYNNNDYRYRYSPTGHFDLADYLADYSIGNMTRLDYASELIGLSADGEVNSAQIAGLFESAQYDKIVSHCIYRVLQTHVLFLRTMHLRGLLADYQDSIDKLRAFLRSEITATKDLGAQLGCIRLLENWK